MDEAGQFLKAFELLCHLKPPIIFACCLAVASMCAFMIPQGSNENLILDVFVAQKVKSWSRSPFTLENGAFISYHILGLVEFVVYLELGILQLVYRIHCLYI